MVGLREFGYVPGKNIVVGVRWAEGQAEGFRTALSELIRLRPEVVVVSSAIDAVEAKQATTSIPVVFIGVPDPVGIGLAHTLARPGGNLTGLARAAGDRLVWVEDCGRDAHYWAPPAQIRTCGIPAYGSYRE